MKELNHHSIISKVKAHALLPFYLFTFKFALANFDGLCSIPCVRR